jgi:hypothetical protein
MIESINQTLHRVYEVYLEAMRDPLTYAYSSAAWMINFGAAVWLILFTANFVLRMLGL